MGASQPVPAPFAHGVVGRPGIVPDAAALLEPWELERAARFADQRDRAAYEAAHALVRVELARLVGGSAGRWRLSGGGDRALAVAEGPELTGPAPVLRLSIAHARGLVAAAVASGPIGVDAESLPTDWDLAAVADRIAGEDEVAAWRRRGADPLELLARWCSKEAVSKALGIGLALDPRAIEVELHGGADAERGSACAAGAEFALRLGAPDPRSRAVLAVGVELAEAMVLELVPATRGA